MLRYAVKGGKSGGFRIIRMTNDPGSVIIKAVDYMASAYTDQQKYSRCTDTVVALHVSIELSKSDLLQAVDSLIFCVSLTLLFTRRHNLQHTTFRVCNEEVHSKAHCSYQPSQVPSKFLPTKQKRATIDSLRFGTHDLDATISTILLPVPVAFHNSRPTFAEALTAVVTHKTRDQCFYHCIFASSLSNVDSHCDLDLMMSS